MSMSAGNWAMAGSTAGSVAANIYGARRAANTAREAGRTQERASERALDFQRERWGDMSRGYNSLQQAQAPFLNLGQNSASTLGRLLTPGAGYAPMEATRRQPMWEGAPQVPVNGQMPSQQGPMMPGESGGQMLPQQGGPFMRPQVQDRWGRSPGHPDYGMPPGGGERTGPSGPPPQWAPYEPGNYWGSPGPNSADPFGYSLGSLLTPYTHPFVPPQQPRPMARGGIVNRPTVALIGEAGPEAVVPLPGSQYGPRRMPPQRGMMPRTVGPSGGPMMPAFQNYPGMEAPRDPWMPGFSPSPGYPGMMKPGMDPSGGRFNYEGGAGGPPMGGMRPPMPPRGGFAGGRPQMPMQKPGMGGGMPFNPEGQAGGPGMPQMPSPGGWRPPGGPEGGGFGQMPRPMPPSGPPPIGQTGPAFGTYDPSFGPYQGEMAPMRPPQGPPGGMMPIGNPGSPGEGQMGQYDPNAPQLGGPNAYDALMAAQQGWGGNMFAQLMAPEAPQPGGPESYEELMRRYRGQ